MDEKGFPRNNAYWLPSKCDIKLFKNLHLDWLRNCDSLLVTVFKYHTGPIDKNHSIITSLNYHLQTHQPASNQPQLVLTFSPGIFSSFNLVVSRPGTNTLPVFLLKWRKFLQTCFLLFATSGEPVETGY